MCRGRPEDPVSPGQRIARSRSTTARFSRTWHLAVGVEILFFEGDSPQRNGRGDGPVRLDAYAVVSATLTVTLKGQTAARTGTLAYTFSKHGEAWKIDAQAWGRTS